MKVLFGYKGLKGKLKNPVVAIGIFDGVHLGHKRVIKKVITAAGKKRDKVIVTFDPHPKTILLPKGTPPRIMSLQHRLSIFEKMGIDTVVVIHFTEFIANMSPMDFVKHVLKGIGAKQVYIGSNFYFGHGRKGDSKHLIAIGKKEGFLVKTVAPVKQRGKIISSTWLRNLILSGKIDKAEKLLRRPVSVFGTVVKGDQRGKTLGVPTANIDPHQEVIPPPGVYAVIVSLGGKVFNGILNVGFKPTFYGRQLKRREEPQIEVHILDFKGELYGRDLEIFFIKRLRREKKFKNGEALKEQIKKDINRAMEFLLKGDSMKRIMDYKVN